MKKVSFFVILTIAAQLLWSLPVSACGCGLLIDASPSGWAYGEDSPEQAYINLDNGVEKLIIGLDIKHADRNAVLVIPIPSTPTNITADVLSEIPQFHGYDVSARVKDNLSAIRAALVATQIYPIAVAVPYVLSQVSGSQRIGANASRADAGDAAPDITVYQHLEKAGMIAEVLSAATPDALYHYLADKGLKVENNSIPVFRDYITNDFSFVVSWINPAVATASARGLQMTFPTKTIFYPLKPGSAYAGTGTAKTITVLGYISPNVYPDINDATDISYRYSDESVNFANFFSSPAGFGFTRIVIHAPPSRLTQDLAMSNSAPLRILHAQFINQHTLGYSIILLILFSFASTYLALWWIGIIPLSNLLGLTIASCFTLIGTILGARHYLSVNRRRFIISFSLIFIVLVMVTTSLLTLLY